MSLTPAGSPYCRTAGALGWATCLDAAERNSVSTILPEVTSGRRVHGSRRRCWLDPLLGGEGRKRTADFERAPAAGMGETRISGTMAHPRRTTLGVRAYASADTGMLAFASSLRRGSSGCRGLMAGGCGWCGALVDRTLAEVWRVVCDDSATFHLTAHGTGCANQAPGIESGGWHPHPGCWFRRRRVRPRTDGTVWVRLRETVVALAGRCCCLDLVRRNRGACRVASGLRSRVDHT